MDETITDRMQRRSPVPEVVGEAVNSLYASHPDPSSCLVCVWLKPAQLHVLVSRGPGLNQHLATTV